MPQMQDIVLEDATEVEFTFKPISLVNNVGVYRELTEAPFQYQNDIVATVRPAAANNFGQRSTWKITMPVIPKKSNEDECCVPPGEIIRTNHVTIEFFFDKTSSQAKGQILLDLLTSLTNDSQFQSTCLGESLR